MPQYMLDEITLDDVESLQCHNHSLKRYIKGTGTYQNYGCQKFKFQWCRLGLGGKDPEIIPDWRC